MRRLVTASGLAFTLAAAAPIATELDVMSSGGFTAAYRVLAPEFTRRTSVTLDTVYGASMGGAPTSIPMRLGRGEPADVVILAREGLDALVDDGLVEADSRVDLATSRIGMAVRAGAPVPDIATVDALVRTLLEAESIAYSASASGTFLSTVLFPRDSVSRTGSPTNANASWVSGWAQSSPAARPRSASNR